VVIVNDNPLNTVIALLACMAINCVFVIVEHGNEEELNHVISDCVPKIIFDGKIRSAPFPREKRSLADINAICYILYTSGSTSQSKGVVAPIKAVDFCRSRGGFCLTRNTSDFCRSSGGLCLTKNTLEFFRSSGGF
jgi:acyl-coenzyme A synthetase/AMP-(fatty) acid ligase